MRVLRLRIDRFGPLRDVDTGESPLPALTVVTGANEAGKSSFFLALRALLHGIYPASREGNPWAPWDGSDLEIRGDLRTRSGEEYRIHRRLLSTPWGRLIRSTPAGEESEDLGNATVPAAAHVPRSIFEHVHTVTLPELARLQEGNTWKEVRDRLVLGMGSHDLGSPRSVADRLDREANALWRPDRRGSPRDAELRDRISGLSDRLTGARDRDVELREVVRKSEELDERLAELRARLHDLRAVRARAGELLPLERQLDTAERLRSEAGDPDLLTPLPDEPLERVDALERELEALSTALAEHDGEVRMAQADLPDPEPFADALEAERERARMIVSARPVVEDRRGRLNRLRGELTELEARIPEACARLFPGDPAAGIPDRERLERLPLGELTRRIGVRRDARNRRIAAEDRHGASPADRTEPGGAGSAGPEAAERDLAPLPRWALAAVATGTLLLLAAPFAAGASDRPLAGWSAAGLGTAALFAGVLRLIEWGRERRERARETERLRRERAESEAALQTLRAAEGTARADVLELLDGLGLRDEWLHEPDDALAGELESLREQLGEADGLRTEIDRIEHENADLAEELQALRAADPPLADGIPGELSRALPLLESELDRIEARRDARAAAERRMERAEADRDRTATEHERKADQLEHLVDALARAVPGRDEPRTRARHAAERLAALRRARAIEHEVIESRGPVDSVRRELRELQGEPLLGGRGVDDLDREIADLAERVSELNAERTGLQKDAERLLEGETADQVEEALLRCREERQGVREDRDRLWLLARVVRVAEKEFRENHQPELIRRAERHLARITGGRYAGLLLGEESDPDALLLRASHLPGPVPVKEPVSTGTREQVFLALRLAILELLERDGEPLPLLLDEALVNWDERRRGHALDLLAELAQERQIFLLTCHAGLAREVTERGGRAVALEGP